MSGENSGIMHYFYIAGIAETCSTLSLYLIAVPLKYLGDNEILVRVIGPIHGLLWLLYIGLLASGLIRNKWNIRAVITGGFLSLLPGGPIWLERRMNQSEYLPNQVEQKPDMIGRIDSR